MEEDLRRFIRKRFAIATEIEKEQNYRHCDGWKSDNYSKSNKENKQRTDNNTKVKKIKSNICKRSNREKSIIAIKILKKK